MQSVLVLLYSRFPRSESNKNNNCGKAPLPSNAAPSTQTPQGQPCSTGVGNNPLTITKPSRCAVSRMPKARRSRLSLTRRAGWATFYAYPLATHFERISFPHFPSTQKIAARSLRNRNETRRFLPYPALSSAYQILPANYRVLFRSDLRPCAPDFSRRLCATASSSRLLRRRRSNPQTTGSHSPQCYQDLHR